MLQAIPGEDDARVRFVGQLEHPAHRPSSKQSGFVNQNYVALNLFLQLLVHQQSRDGVGILEAFLTEYAATGVGRGGNAMEVSTGNEHGVLSDGAKEIVARNGRSYASVNIALCDDGLYRQSVSLLYSYGGYVSPISIETAGYATFADARTAGTEELLRRWPTPFPSDPKSVHEELADMRRQIAGQLQQPTFL